MESLLDHVILTVKDLDRSIAFYEAALKPLGIVHALDYDGKNGPVGHPDLKGFGRDVRVFFWLRQGDADAKAAHKRQIEQRTTTALRTTAAILARVTLEPVLIDGVRH